MSKPRAVLVFLGKICLWLIRGFLLYFVFIPIVWLASIICFLLIPLIGTLDFFYCLNSLYLPIRLSLFRPVLFK